MNTFVIIILAISSYLIGSFPSGYVLAKHVKKIDIRDQGSKSTGATNTTRVLGLKYGLIALLMDTFKGIIIMSILVIFKLEQFYLVGTFNILALYGALSVIGHVFPIYLNFKGGKAVATSFGVLVFLTPLLGLAAAVVLIIVVVITKYVSLGSIIAASLSGITALILSLLKVDWIKYMANPSLTYVPVEYGITIAILASLIVFKHYSNICRMLDKNENKISPKFFKKVK